MRRLGLILFFIIITCIPVYAQAASPIHQQVGKYTIVPYEPPQNQTEQNLTYKQGATNTLSFWNLPQWIQIACVVQALIGLFVIIKILPIVIGRLSTLHKNKRAKKVIKYIKDNPSSTMSQISRETNINRDTVKYYVYQFISQGKLVIEKFGRQSLLFKVPSKYNAYEKKVISYLHDEASRKVLFSILENPGILNVELSKKFKLYESTTHWHVERLLNDNIITFDKQGKSKKYYIDDKAEKIVMEYREYYDKNKDNK